MGRQAGKQHNPARQPQSRPLTLLACLLPALCGACSWVQALQDSFIVSFGNAGTQPLDLPVTEVPVRMVYPHGTDNVGSAVSYMLEPHAYRPAYRDASGGFIAQRRFINNFGTEPVPLSRAMERLAGPDAQVLLDRDRKLYAFRLRKPGEPGVAFADLDAAPLAAAAVPVSWEQPDQPVSAPVTASREQAGQPGPAPAGDNAPGAGRALLNAGLPHTEVGNETLPAEDLNSCRSIQFRNRTMLSATVREYFLKCGFDEVSWKLGEPGRYADYRLSQDIDMPLPERHLDLIDLLQTRFGIKTLINEDNSVEFHDENSTY